MYKVIMKYPDGSTEEIDEVFESESEANAHGLDLVGCYTTGGDVLHMSNPGDHPMSDDEADFEVVEV